MEAEWDCEDFEVSSSTGLLPRDALEIQARHRPRCSGMASTSLFYRARRMPRRSGDSLKGNCTEGQLTRRGLSLMLREGHLLRKRYVDRLGFLPSDMDSSQIYVRSSDMERTMASAQALLLGLYPEKSRPAGSRSVLEIDVAERGDEDMYPEPLRCPRLLKVEADLRAAVADQREKLFPGLDDAVAALFRPGEGRVDAAGLFDILEAREAAGLPLPPGVTEKLAQQVRAAALFHLHITSASEDFLALSIGRFLRHVTDTVADRLTSRGSASTPRFLTFSAHDSTLAAVLGALGVELEAWPRYASTLIIEGLSMPLADTPAQGAFFRVIYNGKVIKGLPGCQGDIEGICPLAQLQARAQKVLSEDC